MNQLNNQWIDASLPISNESLVWPGDDPLRIRPTCQVSNGEMCNESRIEIGSHNTTHIDAPYHFDTTGKRIDEVDLKVFVGPAWVLQVDDVDLITRDHVERIPAGEFERVILKTRNTKFLDVAPFREDYVGVDPAAAQFLVAQGCRIVGIDYYSICPFTDLETTHRALLCNDVAIIESLVLKEVGPGPVDMIALPLRITAGDASPARVLIRPR